jgi:hypothetical protein
MKLIVTIDTEEDSWGYTHRPEYSVENIKQIPFVQQIFDEYGALPTYLITYPVATNEASVALLREIAESGRGEIGTHCHPWSTPPFEEEMTERNSMLCHLPPDLTYRKIETLHNAITKHFPYRPTSFRSGRWGYGPGVAAALDRLGYKVDTSVTALTDWSASKGPDFSHYFPDPYYFNPEAIDRAEPTGRLLQVPATVGFLQPDFRRANALFTRLRAFPALHLVGIFDRLGWCNKVTLSPEQSSGEQMIALLRTLIRKKMPLAHLFFHSPTFSPGLTSFVRTEADRVDFFNRIRAVLQFAKEAGLKPLRLSDAPTVIPRC